MTEAPIEPGDDTSPMPLDHREDIILDLADGSGKLDGYLVPTDKGLVAQLEHVEVDENQRGKGKGAELVRQFAQQAIDNGAVELSAVVAITPLAYIMGQVFGGDKVHCSIGEDTQRTYFDLTYPEALDYITEVESVTNKHEMAGVDTPDAQRSGIRMEVTLTDPEVRHKVMVGQDSDSSAKI